MELGENRQMRSLTLVNTSRPLAVAYAALALAAALAHGAALAQEGAVGPEGDTTADSECSPACRAGFACVDGVCRSPCNPPCGYGEVCSRGGSCVPIAPAAEPATQRPAPTPGGGWTAPATQASSGPAFDQTQYEMYKRKRGNGAALMAIGIITVLAAGGIGFAAGYTGEMNLLWVAIGVEVLGDLLFFPGLAVWIKGKKGMERLERNRAARASPAGSGLRLAGVAPLLSPENPRSGGGLALSFVF